MKTRSGREPPGAPAELDTGHPVTALYQAHYRSLVRLAVLLISDLATAEEIVQDSFVAAYDAWAALPDADAALCYLRRSVVRRSRSASPPPLVDGPRADLPPQESAVVAALRALPARQREVVVLRYFADLPEAEIALVTGIRKAEVRSHVTRAMSSLRAGLPTTGD